MAEQRKLGIYLLGGTTGAIAVASKLRFKHSRLNISCDNSHVTPQQAAQRSEAIRQSGDRILFVGTGVSRQEYVLEEHWKNLGVNLTIGVGGSFDVIALRKKRSPRWVRFVGLEWFYRLLQEPRRMWKRYL